MGLILTEGSKKRLLVMLDELTVYVRMDQSRETIMWQAAKIIPAVISEFNYYEPTPPPNKGLLRLTKSAGRPHHCDGIIDPKFTKRIVK